MRWLNGVVYRMKIINPRRNLERHSFIYSGYLNSESGRSVEGVAN